MSRHQFVITVELDDADHRGSTPTGAPRGGPPRRPGCDDLVQAVEEGLVEGDVTDYTDLDAR